MEKEVNNQKGLTAQERIELLLQSENIIPERPPSLDEKGRRLDIFPAAVRGRFRRYRTSFYLFLVFIFLILPWTRFAGEQTVHLNITKGQFVFFGKTLFAHDGPFIFLFFGIVVFGLALATSWYGRVWCGWACPQTVFIDIIYRKIEEWIEGNHIARKKLVSSPWTFQKILKKSFKWSLYVLISIHIAHSFFAYFVGARELLFITLDSPFENLGLFIAVYVISFLTLINFGWFREQFCLVACPYGRLQAALMDEKSISVFYDPLRGEPRRDKTKVAAGKKDYGDCVNCFKCVNVCPTGIDIRDGVQLECIACTACIDACDEVMDKLKKPRGLIRYASEMEIRTGEKQSHAMAGVRTKIYAVIVALLFVALFVFLNLRENISIKALRATDAPYQVVDMAGGVQQIINHFRFHITNQSGTDLNIQDLKLLDDRFELVAPSIKTNIEADKDKWVHIFVKFNHPGPLTHGKAQLGWRLFYLENEQTKSTEGQLNIIGPE